jgi:hypothetical protein
MSKGRRHVPIFLWLQRGAASGYDKIVATDYTNMKKLLLINPVVS